MSSSDRCPECGKRGKRPCPATGGLICAACCGAHRGSKLSCPADCSFYPFGTAAYDLFLETDKSWTSKTMTFLKEHFGTGKMAETVGKFVPRVSGDSTEEKAVAAYFPALYYGLLVERGTDGKMAVESWEGKGLPGLNNDERVMMRYRQRSYATVIEVQRTVSADTLECLDLLSPGSKPFVLADRLAAKSIPRFTRLLVWLTHYPHFSQMNLAGFEIPELVWPMWLQTEQQRLAEQQKIRPELTLSQLLAETMAESGDLIAVLVSQARKQMLEYLDVHRCLAQYRLSGTAEEVKKLLESKPDFERREREPGENQDSAEQIYLWVGKGESAEYNQTMPAVLRTAGSQGGILGTVALTQDKLILGTFSKSKHDFGRKIIEKLLSQLVQFEDESVVDMAEQFSLRQQLWPQAKRSGQPQSTQAPPSAQDTPAPAGKRDLAWKAHKEHTEKLLDTPTPLLNGLTPRAAAQDANVRPKLVEWLKGHLHSIDVRNRRDGLDLNIDWVLDELGVPELK